LFAAAPAHGAPLLKANFPRAFVDVNRDARELDPGMFEGQIPAEAIHDSPRAAAGYGVVARVVAGGRAIYSGRLRFEDAQDRIATLHAGYHETLRRLVESSRRRFGVCLLIDCHSMPSREAVEDRDAHLRDVDIVLGDCWGSSCDALLTDTVEGLMKDLGLSVRRNRPYAGGYTTRHYGAPDGAVHALQIEVNRSLYMDEERIERKPCLPRLAWRLDRFIGHLVRIDWSSLAGA
jgi:N-formylglutamate amidohydrolase